MEEKRRHFMIAGLIALVLAAVLLITGVAEPSGAVSHGNVDTIFSCFTYDDQGHRLNGFQSEKDNAWYLFVTATQLITEVELHFTGNVDRTTGGVLDRDAAVVTGAFQNTKDQVILTAEDGTTHTVIVMQSNLPSLYVDMNGITLEEVHRDKSKKHGGTSVYIMDPNGKWDLTADGSVEI